MERAILREQLELAERRVAFGEQMLANHRLRVIDLERLGEDATTAKAMVIELEELLRLYVFDRDGLRRELNDSSE
jgi:hypothetical protein